MKAWYLLLSIIIVSIMSAAGGNSKSEEEVNKADFMKAKRAYDRVKRHPIEEPAPPKKTEEKMVDYKAQDGTIKKMSKTEMNRRLEDQAQFPQMDADGKIMKSQEGKANLDELREKDPFLASVVDAAHLAVSRLQAQGYALGRLKSLNSVEDQVMIGSDNQQPKMRLLLTIEAAGSRVETQYEVILEHLGSGRHRLVEASSVSAGGKRTRLELAVDRGAPGRWEITLAGNGLMLLGIVALMSGILLITYTSTGSRSSSSSKKAE